MIAYFYTPFPRPKNSRKNVFSLFLFSIICNIFILIFKPFDIENQTGEFLNYLLLMSLGLVFFLSIYIMEFLVPTLFKKAFEKWTLGKAILWYTWVIFFVGASMFLYKSFLGGFRDFTIKEYFLVTGRVVSISLVVSFFVLGLISYVNRKQISLVSNNVNYQITSPEAKPLRVNLKEILYIESDDNYVDIHLLKQGKRSKEVFRSSLKNIENQLVNPVSPIHRCHRQFLINIQHFEIQKKTSRSMTIKLLHGDDIVAVSKKYMEPISELLQTRP
jgi:hypothetical protein